MDKNNMCIETLENLCKCSCCGNTFNKTSFEWAWRYKTKIVCSYHCMRSLELADPTSFESIRRAEKLGLPPAKPVVRPAKPRPRNFIPAQKLPDEKIEAIKHLYLSGMTPYAVSKRLKLSTSTVYKYIKGVERVVTNG